ncbi:ATP-binding protein [Streptomyces sp. NRRL F-5650]|uniref:ATP-binding protein n=1 Tax=Streptomyces sp. NRRL F-5650 TaxID=1463868 RepID=UPI0004CBC08E|nr:ATP-binding protein [Streptomyces sp. NRRL F-5650]
MIGVSDNEGECVEWVFPAAPHAVRTARSRVRRALEDWRLDGVGDIAVLLVSELVTNALRHAAGPIGVRLVHGPAGPGAVAGVLRVEVSDSVPDPPRGRTVGPDDEDGRGLQLLAAVARDWGTRPHGTGKAVWFELALPAEVPTDVPAS